MRRLLAGFLTSALLLLAPALASAQIGAGAGQAICETRASANVGNTATATQLFTCAVPAGAGGSPMHVSLMGTISTANTGTAGATILLTCNYGGANASVTLANLSAANFAFGFASAPWTADVWYRPVASFGASPVGGPTPVSSTGQFMVGKFSFASQNAFGAASYTMGSVDGFVDNLGAQTFTCNWQWAAANANNFILMKHGIMTIGN